MDVLYFILYLNETRQMISIYVVIHLSGIGLTVHNDWLQLYQSLSIVLNSWLSSAVFY